MKFVCVCKHVLKHIMNTLYTSEYIYLNTNAKYMYIIFDNFIYKVIVKTQVILGEFMFFYFW